MDALQMCDKKLREPMGQKYMGARSIEDLTSEPDVTKQQERKESTTGANGLPVLPPKSKESEGSKSPTDKQKQVSSEGMCVLLFALILFCRHCFCYWKTGFVFVAGYNK